MIRRISRIEFMTMNKLSMYIYVYPHIFSLCYFDTILVWEFRVRSRTITGVVCRTSRCFTQLGWPLKENSNFLAEPKKEKGYLVSSALCLVLHWSHVFCLCTWENEVIQFPNHKIAYQVLHGMTPASGIIFIYLVIIYLLSCLSI